MRKVDWYPLWWGFANPSTNKTKREEKNDNSIVIRNKKDLISNFRNFLKSNDKSSQKMLRDLWMSLDSQSFEFQGSSCLIQNPKRQQWLWSFNLWCLIGVESFRKQQEWNEIMLHQTIFRNQKYSLKNSFEIELIFHHCVFVINSSTTESFQNHYKTLSKTIFFFKNMGKIKYW